MNGQLSQIAAALLYFIAIPLLVAQKTQETKPDVSDKALITKAPPQVAADKISSAAEVATLHKLAEEYYAWRNENYPGPKQRRGAYTPGMIA